MNYNEFIRNIEKDNILYSYLFIGDEEYLMNVALEELKNKYIEDSFENLNYVYLDGKYTLLQDLINACETLPFMSSKKIVVLKDTSAFLENIKDNTEKKFYEYMEDLGDYLILIFVDSTLAIKKTTRFYKFFNKKNMAVEFTKLTDVDLRNWSNTILKKYNKKISPADISYFIENTSYRSKNLNLSLYDLENELLKLINYSSNEYIKKEDIDKILIKSIDTNIFELLDSINKFDADTSIKVFNNMYLNNEPIPRIFFMIIRQIRLLLSYKLYNDKGYTGKLIQDKLGIKDYEFKKIMSQASNFKTSQLERIMEYLLEMDLRLKTVSSQDKLEMEILLVKLCQRSS